jgi:2,5-diketo-D-gluconate reductase A
MDAQSTTSLITGRKMPILGFGTWQLNHQPVETLLEAIKMGYRMIDTSGDYGTQAAVGEAVKKCKIDRKELFIVTKVEETDEAYSATKENLNQLGLDYVDLMLIHRPPKNGIGQELWDGLIKAKREGLTKDIGISNYSIEETQGLIEASGVIPAVNQIEWTPFGYSFEMLDYCQANRITIQAYSPLTHDDRLDDPDLEELADRYGKTTAQLLLRWNLQMGTVPIVKANQKEHLQENLNIFDFEIAEEDMEALYSLNEAYSSLGGSLSYINKQGGQGEF